MLGSSLKANNYFKKSVDALHSFIFLGHTTTVLFLESSFPKNFCNFQKITFFPKLLDAKFTSSNFALKVSPVLTVITVVGEEEVWSKPHHRLNLDLQMKDAREMLSSSHLSMFWVLCSTS